MVVIGMQQPRAASALLLFTVFCCVTAKCPLAHLSLFGAPDETQWAGKAMPFDYAPQVSLTRPRPEQQRVCLDGRCCFTQDVMHWCVCVPVLHTIVIQQRPCCCQPPAHSITHINTSAGVSTSFVVASHRSTLQPCGRWMFQLYSRT